ncbi:hypothetical protein [Streptomyces similanensis]|uniref:Uncharacterized protein n=1 Tax=Streptomyces similanensis TaxID=1274988 RepID=A0ABP9L7H3_9ACTN
MPVSLDKTPEPRPEDMDRAPAYRAELRKLTAGFFVYVDTVGQWTPRTPDDRIDVLSVERAATNDVERELQRIDGHIFCLETPGFSCLELTAISAADAAGQARLFLSLIS